MRTARFNFLLRYAQGHAGLRVTLDLEPTQLASAHALALRAALAEGLDLRRTRTVVVERWPPALVLEVPDEDARRAVDAWTKATTRLCEALARHLGTVPVTAIEIAEDDVSRYASAKEPSRERNAGSEPKSLLADVVALLRLFDWGEAVVSAFSQRSVPAVPPAQNLAHPLTNTEPPRFWEPPKDKDENVRGLILVLLAALLQVLVLILLKVF